MAATAATKTKAAKQTVAGRTAELRTGGRQTHGWSPDGQWKPQVHGSDIWDQEDKKIKVQGCKFLKSSKFNGGDIQEDQDVVSVSHYFQKQYL